jgi:hypothetical protein
MIRIVRAPGPAVQIAMPRVHESLDTRDLLDVDYVAQDLAIVGR